ncbi:MAG: hypothetical protein BWY82_00783 [Verrucomicrobia bacterium ADurb.Bin474]|nr:MAG: hypothetical protein BWY82_00783 [Verrucomicrobia bacterium ADurb.Bin474]
MPGRVIPSLPNARLLFPEQPELTFDLLNSCLHVLDPTPPQFTLTENLLATGPQRIKLCAFLFKRTIHFGPLGLDLGRQLVLGHHRCLQFGHLRLRLRNPRAVRTRFGGEINILTGIPRPIQMLHPVALPLPAQCLACLSLERAHALGHLINDVGYPRQVYFRQTELVEGLFALAFVFGDSGSLFKNRPPFHRIGRQNLVDLPLHQKGIGNLPYPRIHKQVLDILQPAYLTVDEIVTPLIPCDSTDNLNLMKLCAKLPLAIGEHQFDLTKRKRLPVLGSCEDNILHLAPTQGLGALFSKDPADGIHDVALSTAIRPNHSGHSRPEIQLSRISKAFETVQCYGFEKHRDSQTPEILIRMAQSTNSKAHRDKGCMQSG